MDTTLRAALTLLPRKRPDTLPELDLMHTVRVDREHLAEYDRVCGFPLTDTLPATYPHVLAFPLAMRLMSRPDFPFPVVGLIHVANRITVRRPLTADTPVTFRVRAADLRPHDRGRRFDVTAQATVDGEVVWTGVSTYLRKEGDPARERERGDRPDPPRPTAVWRIPARVGTDYAAVSGDHNPIHTSRLGARLFGFPRPIAHGMWSAARCLAALGPRLPDACETVVTFKRPITLPGRAGFCVTRIDGGWEFQLDGRGPHLAGRVTSI